MFYFVNDIAKYWTKNGSQTLPLITNLRVHMYGIIGRRVPSFSHNMSACAFRFHDYAFLGMKKVTLTNETHFEGRSRCSVQFYNLPRGIVTLALGQSTQKKRFISQRFYVVSQFTKSFSAGFLLLE